MVVALTEKIDLTHPPQSNDANWNIRQIKIALNRLGFYTPDPSKGITAEVDDHFKDALYAFQRKTTIFFDDVDLGPGSTTERMLNEEIARHGAMSLIPPAYVWRTADDDKVRDGHATRHGQRFSWNTPPEGGHPGEDYNCRCWADPINPPWHPWIEWVKEREEERQRRTDTVQKLAPPRRLNHDLITNPPLDAINPTVSPLDFVGFGAPIVKVVVTKSIPYVLTGISAAKKLPPTLAAKIRDTSWIKDAEISQIQHAFGKAIQFGVKGNWNKENGEKFKAALQEHIKSPDTKIVIGEYHTNKVTHYYNPITKLNVIRNQKGQFVSAWKLNEKQVHYMENGGKLGGSGK